MRPLRTTAITVYNLITGRRRYTTINEVLPTRLSQDHPFDLHFLAESLVHAMEFLLYLYPPEWDPLPDVTHYVTIARIVSPGRKSAEWAHRASAVLSLGGRCSRLLKAASFDRLGLRDERYTQRKHCPSSHTPSSSQLGDSICSCYVSTST